ncbi:hypothetical protein Tco_0937145 [Tanacetum coccineum]|uniref:Uncharacterized protein n=1 Tax=Tanacetum coccineum TaxID=301880 RepID=A0ABQ5DDD6_9ASTR
MMRGAVKVKVDERCVEGEGAACQGEVTVDWGNDRCDHVEGQIDRGGRIGHTCVGWHTERVSLDRRDVETRTCIYIIGEMVTHTELGGVEGHGDVFMIYTSDIVRAHGWTRQLQETATVVSKVSACVSLDQWHSDYATSCVVVTDKCGEIRVHYFSYIADGEWGDCTLLSMLHSQEARSEAGLELESDDTSLRVLLLRVENGFDVMRETIRWRLGHDAQMLVRDIFMGGSGSTGRGSSIGCISWFTDYRLVRGGWKGSILCGESGLEGGGRGESQAKGSCMLYLQDWGILGIIESRCG